MLYKLDISLQIAKNIVACEIEKNRLRLVLLVYVSLYIGVMKHIESNLKSTNDSSRYAFLAENDNKFDFI